MFSHSFRRAGIERAGSLLVLLVFANSLSAAGKKVEVAFPPETGWLLTVSLVAIGAVICCVFLFFKVSSAEKERLRLRNVVWRAPFACLVVAREDRSLLVANNRALEVLGLPFDYRGRRLDEFIERSVIDTILQEIREMGEFLDKELRMRTTAGGELWTLLSATEMQRYGRRVLFVNFSDITEQKRVHEELVHANARFEALLEASPDGIVTISLDGTVRFANDQALRQGRFANAEQIVGQKLQYFIPEAQRLFFQDGLAKLASGQEGLAEISKLIRADGSFIWVEPRSVVLKDPYGGESQVLIVVRDITERKEAEERVAEHARKLEEALAKVAKLQNDMLSICAWTKQVCVDGEWLPVDVYLSKHLGLKISHGISGDGLKLLEKSGGLPDTGEERKAEKSG